MKCIAVGSCLHKFQSVGSSGYLLCGFLVVVPLQWASDSIPLGSCADLARRSTVAFNIGRGFVKVCQLCDAIKRDFSGLGCGSDARTHGSGRGLVLPSFLGVWR